MQTSLISGFPGYFGMALAGALAMSLSSLLGKIILRYRICDAGLMTWGQGLAAAVAAGLVIAATATPVPAGYRLPAFATAFAVIVSTWMLNLALQEGDISSVVPLMGSKIPMTALLAIFWLGERAVTRTWIAIICAGAALALFGAGTQRPAEGGHGRRPGLAIGLALAASLGYAVSDTTARLALDGMDPLALTLWTNVCWGPAALLMLTRPRYRRYRVTPLDAGMLALRAILIMFAVTALYGAFRLAEGVILPNVVFGAQGFFALIAGWLLNRGLRIPFERQSRRIYLLRTAGSALLFAALLLVAAG